MHSYSSGTSSTSEDDDSMNLKSHSSEFNFSEFINYRTQNSMNEINPDSNIYKTKKNISKNS